MRRGVLIAAALGAVVVGAGWKGLHQSDHTGALRSGACRNILQDSAGSVTHERLLKLDSALQAHAAKGFSGVVLIGDSSGITAVTACGSLSTIGDSSLDRPFWLASNSKQFTAATIMRLADRQRLSVNDPITRFFENVPPDKRAITVRELLLHTSGLPHEYRADGVVDRTRAVADILKLKLKSQPGQNYSYSNDGYSLLAAIVEVASGMSFDTYLQDSVFTPAGLTHTGLWGHEREAIAQLVDSAASRKQEATIFHNKSSVANWGYRGPTGVYSSARDMYRWIEALRRGQILTQKSFDALVGPQFLLRSDSTGKSYGAYGWGRREEPGRKTWIAHLGNEDWLGHNSVIRFTPEGDVVLVLSNSGDFEDRGWSSAVNSSIRAVLDARN